MFGQKNIIYIWVGRSGLTVMGGKITEPVNLAIPESAVVNMEVRDRDEVYSVIKEWARQYPAIGQEIVWILGREVCFEKVMGEGELERWESEVVGFLELLPFDEVESRVYTTVSGRLVVAISKDFFQALEKGFALQGYVTKFEIPERLLGLREGESLNRQVVKEVGSKLASLQKLRLVESERGGMEGAGRLGDEKKRSSLPVLLGVFGVLLVILVVMLTSMR